MTPLAVYWVGSALSFWFWFDAVRSDDDASWVITCCVFAFFWPIVMPMFVARVLEGALKNRMGRRS